jgi:predicted MFS family arabinose efflux permease
MESIRRVVSKPLVLHLLLVRFLQGFSLAMFHSVLPLVFKNEYGLAVDQAAPILSYIGVLIAVTQLNLGAITKRYTEVQIILTGSCIFGSVLWVLLLENSLPMVLIVLIPFVCSGTVLNTIVSATLTKVVAKTETGTVLGLDMGVGTFCRVITPAIGGYAFSKFGYSSIIAISGSMGMLLFLFTFSILQFHPSFKTIQHVVSEA